MVEDPLAEDRPHAGPAGGQRVRAQQRDRSCHPLRQRLAHARRVAADQVHLQLADARRRDHDLRERAEPRRDAVDDALLAHRALDDRARCLDPRARRRGQRDARRRRPRHAVDILEPQRCAGQLQCVRHAAEYRPARMALQARAARIQRRITGSSEGRSRCS